MKIINKKIKIGQYKGMDVFIDWNYLRRERGLRKEETQFQIVLGRFLQIFSVLLFFFLFIYFVSLGEFLLSDLLSPDDFWDLGVFVLFGSFIYSFYLLRNREKYFDTLDLRALNSLRSKLQNDEKIDSVEILDFVHFQVLNILDDVVVRRDENAYELMLKELLRLKEVKILLARLGVSEVQLVESLEKYNFELTGDKTDQINKILFQSFVVGFEYGFSYVGAWVVFLKLVLEEYFDLMQEFGVKRETLIGLLEWTRSQAQVNRYKKEWRYRSSLKPKSVVNRSFTSGYTQTLNKYSRDLTVEVARDEFLYALNREEEIADTLRFLRQAGGAFVLFLGEPGVGKSTILKSIAVRMVVEDVPGELKDMRLVEFNFQRAIAKAGSASALRDVIAKVFEEVAKAKNIVLVIDDIDQLVNVREEISDEIISTITKALEVNKLKLVATTTKIGFRRYIKINPQLASKFDLVEIDEHSPEVSLQIALDERSRLEKKYGVKILFEALEAAVDLTVRYDTTRLLPQKALDTIEDACIYALEENLENVSAKAVEKIVSSETGMKVGSLNRSETELLMKLESIMHKRIVGQDKAVSAVADALRRARAGLAGGSRPIASFLFFGPTGVGKTEVARTLAEVYYGDEDLLTRLDMSEFQEEKNIQRLIGHMQGSEFVGGLLTEKVREKPFSLVLLDEIEKANPRVLDLFLQVLDEGFITDGAGRKVDFRNTIVIATSNVGSRAIAGAIEAGKKYDEAYRIAQIELKKNLRIEFINRFDKVIMFKPLSRVEIEKIAGIMMEKVVDKLNTQGIDLKYTPNLLKGLAEKGYSPVFGAREMRRVIQDEVESKLAELIVSGKLKSGDDFVMDGLE